MITADYGGMPTMRFQTGTAAVEYMMFVLFWDYEDTGDEALVKAWERLQDVKLVHSSQYMWVESEQAYMDEYSVDIDEKRSVVFRHEKSP